MRSRATILEWKVPGTELVLDDLWALNPEVTPLSLFIHAAQGLPLELAGSRLFKDIPEEPHRVGSTSRSVREIDTAAPWPFLLAEEVPFVGRTEERLRIARFLRAQGSPEEDPSTLLITGPRGSGVSRLLHYAARLGRERGFRVENLGRLAPSGGSSVEAFSSPDAKAGSGPEQGAPSSRCTLLIGDDIEALGDPDVGKLLNLVNAAPSNGRRVLLLLGQTEDGVPPPRSNLGRLLESLRRGEHRTAVLSLSPLSDTEVRDLLFRDLSTLSLPAQEALIQQALRRSGGLPGRIVQERLGLLALARDPRQVAELREHAELPLPPALLQEVHRRIRRLSTRDRHLIYRCSRLGEEFSGQELEGLLASLGSGERAGWRSGLARLVREGFLRPTTAGQHVFTSTLLWCVCRREAGSELGLVAPPLPPANLQLGHSLPRHSLRAPSEAQAPKAVGELDDCCRHLLHQVRHRKPQHVLFPAIQFHDMVSNAPELADMRAAALLSAARELWWRGANWESLAFSDLAWTLPRSREREIALRAESVFYAVDLDTQRARAELPRLEAEVGTSPDLEGSGAVMAVALARAALDILEDQWEDAVLQARAGLRHADEPQSPGQEGAPDPVVVSRLHWALGWGLRQTARFEESVESFERGAHVADLAHLDFEVARHVGGAASALFAAGDLSRANERFGMAVRLARRARAPQESHRFLLSSATVLLKMGRLKEARAILALCRSEAKSHDFPGHEFGRCTLEGNLDVAEGAWKRARNAYLRALSSLPGFAAATEPWRIAITRNVLIRLARVEAELGNIEGGMTVLRQLTSFPRETDARELFEETRARLLELQSRKGAREVGKGRGAAHGAGRGGSGLTAPSLRSVSTT